MLWGTRAQVPLARYNVKACGDVMALSVERWGGESGSWRQECRKLKLKLKMDQDRLMELRIWKRETDISDREIKLSLEKEGRRAHTEKLPEARAVSI